MNDLFNFSFALLPAILLALIPALFNWSLLGYILLKVQKNSITYTFGLFVFALALWQTGEALGRMSITAYEAAFWADIFGIGSILISPFGMHFVLLFTERNKLARSRTFLFLLYFPAVIFELLTRAGLNEPKLAFNETWGWTTTLPAPLVNSLLGVWVASLAVAILVLLLRYAAKPGLNGEKRRQSLLVAIGFAIPTIQGTITQVVFPTFLNLQPLPVSSTFMTAFTVLTFVALLKYHFLTALSIEERLTIAEQELINKNQHLSTVIENSPVILFSFDKEGVVTLSEGRGLAGLGLKAGQLVGQSVFDIYKDNPGLEDVKSALSGKEFTGGPQKVGKRVLQTHFIPTRNKKDKVIAVSGVSMDVTDRFRAEEELKNKVSQLERMNKFMIGREIKMSEMKNTIEEFKRNSKNNRGGGI